MAYNENFRNELEKRVSASLSDHVVNFVDFRNGDPHENGLRRGYCHALKDVLQWMQETEQDINTGKD